MKLVHEFTAAPAAIPLATVQYGNDPAPSWSPLAIHVPLDVLGPAQTEVWVADETPVLDEDRGFRIAATDALAAGSRRVIDGPLRERTHALYRDLLALCAERGLKLCRVWNTIPRCLEGPIDFLGYMEFCQGRGEAFEEHYGVDFERHLFACTAVGNRAGPQTLHFFATRDGGEPVENPRQVSAYRYPGQYGPHSPSFARALRLPAEGGGKLLISGTASIVGHESLHPGDVRAQTRETVRNLRALLAPDDEILTLRAYLRHSRDLPAAREVLEMELGQPCPTEWLHAELCRPDLLIEVEGVAGKAATPPSSRWKSECR